MSAWRWWTREREITALLARSAASPRALHRDPPTIVVAHLGPDAEDAEDEEQAAEHMEQPPQPATDADEGAQGAQGARGAGDGGADASLQQLPMQPPPQHMTRQKIEARSSTEAEPTEQNTPGQPTSLAPAPPSASSAAPAALQTQLESQDPDPDPSDGDDDEHDERRRQRLLLPEAKAMPKSKRPRLS